MRIFQYYLNISLVYLFNIMMSNTFQLFTIPVTASLEGSLHFLHINSLLFANKILNVCDSKNLLPDVVKR